MKSQELEGKVAIVTGAGSGIGRSTALLFASEGASVMVADISEEGGSKTAELISREFGKERTSFAKTDVSREDDVKNMVSSAVEKFGKLDVIFNNAGIYEWTSVEETPTESGIE